MFGCTCGQKVELKNSLNVCEHMKTCASYQKCSPLYQLFDMDEIKEFKIEQLLVFKADLQTWIDYVAHQLSQKGHAVTSTDRARPNLQSYSMFTSKITDKVPEDTSDSIKNVVQQPVTTIIEPKLKKPIKKKPNIELFDDDSCLKCGRQGSKVFKNECGHCLCQDCFVEMYRSDDLLFCPECHGDFERAFIVKAATDKEAVMCLICDKNYSRVAGVQGHVTQTHVDSNERRFNCNQCNKAFNSWDEITQHKIGKHNINPHFKRYETLADYDYDPEPQRDYLIRTPYNQPVKQKASRGQIITLDDDSLGNEDS